MRLPSYIGSPANALAKTDLTCLALTFAVSGVLLGPPAASVRKVTVDENGGHPFPGARRVAQPLLAFAPTDPIVPLSGNGLFRQMSLHHVTALRQG